MKCHLQSEFFMTYQIILVPFVLSKCFLASEKYSRTLKNLNVHKKNLKLYFKILLLSYKKDIGGLMDLVCAFLFIS